MTWLRACRNVRLIISELSWIVINIACAGAACGVCFAIWLIVSSVVERAGR